MLFTGSIDGSFSLLQIVDKDPRKREPIPLVAPMTETVIPKVQRDVILKKINYLKEEIDTKRAKTNAELDAVKLEK